MKDQKSIDVVVLNEKGFVDRSVKIDPVYLLGHNITRFAQSEYIEDALKKAGCKVKRVQVSWPRNSYVLIGRMYYTLTFFYRPEFQGNPDFLGDGGAVIPANDFVLVSSANISPEQKDAKDEIKKIIPLDIYLIHPFWDISRRSHTHIDTTVGCIPGANLITVDKKHYDKYKQDFEEVRQGTGYDIVPIDAGDEIRLLGNNYLVIQELEKTVINNKAATRVNAELRNLGITVIETSEPLRLMPACEGVVRCATNWLHNGSLLADIELY